MRHCFIYICLVLLAGCRGQSEPTNIGAASASPPTTTSAQVVPVANDPANNTAVVERSAPHNEPPPAVATERTTVEPPSSITVTPAVPPATAPKMVTAPVVPEPTRRDAPVAAPPSTPKPTTTTPSPGTQSTTASPAKPPPAKERRVIPGYNQSDTSELATDGIHDPKNPALATMQNPSQALSVLPLGRWKEVDWMQALTQNKIQPRADRATEGRMEVLDLDVIMTNTKSMPHVRFPHNSHTQWLACSNCHPAIFQPKKGSNPITMDAILKGQFCGTCHGRVAFSSYICQRCHSVVHEGSPQQWW